MAQVPPHTDYQLGSYDVISVSGGYSGQRGYPASYRPTPEVGEGTVDGASVQNFHPDSAIKYPPSMTHERGPHTAPQVVPLRSARSGSGGGGMIGAVASGEMSAVIPITELLRRLDLAVDENRRLHTSLTNNNEILDVKMREFTEVFDKATKEKEDLRKSLSETTNKFFEARVAVMGFKCRQIQLQGELETLRKELEGRKSAGGGGGSSMASMSASYQQQLERLRRENQELLEQVHSSRPDQGSAVQRLQSQFEQLKREKGQADMEALNLSAVVNALNTDIQSLRDKRTLDQDEIQRITGRCQGLELQCHEAERASLQLQARLSQQNSMMTLQPQSRSITQLTSDLEIVQAENINLKAEIREATQGQERIQANYDALHGKYDALSKKCTSLQQNTKLMQQKMERTGVAPIPKLRTNVQLALAEKDRLEEEQQRVVRELEGVREQLDTANRSRTAAESRLKDADKKAQEYCYELAQVKRDLEQARAVGGTPSDELEALKREVRAKEEQIGDLKSERREGREKYERLREEKVALETSSMVPATSPLEKERPRVKPSGIEQRLDKTIGRVRELEKDNADLRDRITAAEDERDEVQEAIQKFQRDLGASQHMSLSLRRESEEYQVRLTQQQEHFESQLAGLREAEDSKSADCAALQENMASVRSQLEQRTEQIGKLTGDVEKKQSELHHLRSRHGQLDGEVERLRGELRQAEVAIKGYEDECKDLLKDYTTCAGDLAGVKEERDRTKNQVEIGLRELTKRADRIKMLEQQRDEAQGRIEHMDMQLKTYTDDFDRERTAREKAMEVKMVFETENGRLVQEVKSLQHRYTELVRQKLQDDPSTNTEDSWIISAGGSPERSIQRSQEVQKPPLRPGSANATGRTSPYIGHSQEHIPNPKISVGSYGHVSDQNQHGTYGYQTGETTTPPGVYGATGYEPGHRASGPMGTVVPGFEPGHRVSGPMTGAAAPPDYPPVRTNVNVPYPPTRTHGEFVPGMTSQTREQPHYQQQVADPRRLSPSPTAITGMRMGGEIGGGEVGGVGGIGGVGLGGGGGGGVGGGGGGRGGAAAAAAKPTVDISMNPMIGSGNGDPTSMAGGAVPAFRPARPHIGNPAMPGGSEMVFASSAGLGTVPNRLVGVGPDQRWVAPGEVIDPTRPTESCPICGKADFKTQTDLEVHCAQCS